MFVTNWISTTKIQKISEITNFFRHYFLSRTEVENTALASWMRDLRERRTFYQQEPALLSNMSKAITRTTRSHPYRRAVKTLGTVFLPSACSLRPMPKLMSHSQRMNPPRRKRGNAERVSVFDVSYKLKIRIEHERRNVGSHLRHS